MFEPFTNGPAIKLPEDAWETGGTLALRSDITTADLTPSTNYTDAALGAFAETGAVTRAATYGTPTRWTDATGCVWETSIMLDRWLAADIGLWQGEAPSWYGPEWYDEPDGDYITERGWWVSCQYLTPEFLGDDASQTTLELNWEHYEGETLSEIHTIFSRPVVTNLVGRVALKNDIPDMSGYATPADVTAAIREQSLGGIWDSQLEVWWTPIMQNGALKYVATTNVDMTVEGNE